MSTHRIGTTGKPPCRHIAVSEAISICCAGLTSAHGVCGAGVLRLCVRLAPVLGDGQLIAPSVQMQFNGLRRG